MRVLIKSGKQNIVTIISYLLVLFLINLMWSFSIELHDSNASIALLQYNISQLTLKKNLPQQSVKRHDKVHDKPESEIFIEEPKEQVIPYNKYFNRGLKIEWWHDVCFERTTWERSWHPLFPYVPQKTTTTLKAGDNDRIVGNFLRRFSGFVYSNTSEYFQFKLLSRDGAEALLLDTGIKLENDSKPPVSLKFAKEIFYLKLTKRIMYVQDRKLSLKEMFFTKPTRVWIEARRLYFVEIIQGGKHFAKCQLHWKRIGDNDFQIIGSDNLLYSYISNLTKILQNSKPQQKFPVLEAERLRHSFHSVPSLQSNSLIKSSNFKCELTKRNPVTIKKLYEGYWYHVDPQVSYPKEYFDYIRPAKTDHIQLAESEAIDVAKIAFQKLNKLHNEKLELQHIVHVQKNLNTSYEPYRDRRRTFYFVELDVKLNTAYGESKTYRSSQYIQPTSDGICFVSDYEWQGTVQINLITPIQNQKQWLEYLIYMLKELQEKTNECNVKLILVDCGSTDGDYQTILESSGISHEYLWLEQKSFSKVKALNYGLRRVHNNNSIAFVMDLHLQLPLNMFDRVRKVTIQGRTAFSPSLMKLSCGEHEQYTRLRKTEWLDPGTGMIALYKSDWINVGGYNEVLYNNKWGGEDWELIDRIAGKGYRVVHSRMPRFYHIHHARKGSWYEKKKDRKKGKMEALIFKNPQFVAMRNL